MQEQKAPEAEIGDAVPLNPRFDYFRFSQKEDGENHQDGYPEQHSSVPRDSIAQREIAMKQPEHDQQQPGQPVDLRKELDLLHPRFSYSRFFSLTRAFDRPFDQKQPGVESGEANVYPSEQNIPFHPLSPLF